MHWSTLLFADDPSSGKVHPFLLSDQTKMELFWQTIKNNDGRNYYDNCCQWFGVQCDAEENVTSIRWGSMGQKQNSGFDGTVDTRLIPSKTTRFDVNSNRLHGSLNLESLPGEIESVDFGRNVFSGEIRLTNLAATLRFLWLCQNKLDGT